MALSCGQLGNLAMEQDQWLPSMAWMVWCNALFADFPSHMTGSGPFYLACLTAILGEGVLRESWQRLTGQPLPDHVAQALPALAAQQPELLAELREMYQQSQG